MTPPTNSQQDRRQGKGVRACASESRPAAGADLTSSLTIRLTEGKAAGPVAHAGTGGTRPRLLDLFCCAGARARGVIAGNYGGGWSGSRPWRRQQKRRGGYVPGLPVRKALMGIDWMTRDELTQAIPPAYTEFIGEQLIEHIATRKAAV